MTRQEEINEFNAMLGALSKKYNVTLGVSIIDLSATTNNDTKPVEAEVVKEAEISEK